MRKGILVVAILFGIIVLAGCSPSNKYSMTPKSPIKIQSNENKIKLGIYGTILSVKIQAKNTILTVEVGSVQKVFYNSGHIPIHKGSVISILYQGTPKDYFVGAGSPTKYLPVWADLNIATIITSTNSGITWNSLFDSYEFLKYGAYMNWKGQNFGEDVFG